MMLSTLHTNDAPGAIARLNEMGIETFLTASAVDCVVAQRLARKLCSGCKKAFRVPAASIAEAGVEGVGDLEGYQPVGCARCGHAGYRGRIGIYSVMSLSEPMKELVVNRASERDIANLAREEGMATLREAGIEKVRDGQTSLEEVLRVTT
jgi:type IV pilus assembly protein PilB